jgi:hypothetical protein
MADLRASGPDVDSCTFGTVERFLSSVYDGQTIVVHRMAIAVPQRVRYFSDQLAIREWNCGKSGYVCVSIAGEVVPALIRKIILGL